MKLLTGIPWKLVDYVVITSWLQSASELYRPSDRRLSANLMPMFADKGVSHVQRGGSLVLLSRLSRLEPLLIFQVVPQLYSRD
jgi:hypothetical protein